MADAVSSAPEPPDVDPALKCYLTLAYSLTHGLIRIWSAEAASARLACACAEFHTTGREGLDGPGANALGHLAKIDFETFDAWSYVTNISHLVYATTILDTFLSDTTLFLFLLFPNSMGKNQQVPLRKVIDARSRTEVITQAAATRTREISYLPFPARLQFLVETFGLKVDLTAEQNHALEHYPSIRNTAVHDQGLFELSVDENGRPVSKPKSCPRHPTVMDPDDVQKSIRAYQGIARTVAAAVCCQVLRQQDHPLVKQFIVNTLREERSNNQC